MFTQSNSFIESRITIIGKIKRNIEERKGEKCDFIFNYQFDDRYAEELAKIIESNEYSLLRAVSIIMTNVTDEGIKRLSDSLLQNTSVRYINLDWKGMKDKEMKVMSSLCKLVNNYNLKEICLGRKEEISEEYGIGLLKEIMGRRERNIDIRCHLSFNVTYEKKDICFDSYCFLLKKKEEKGNVNFNKKGG